MTLRNKNILVVSPESWDHIFVSKHHYAIHLGKRENRVFFLNPPGKGSRLTRTRFENVLQVDYEGFSPGLRFYPRFLQSKIISRAYRRIEQICGVTFDVIWSFDNSVFFDFSALPSATLKISHIVDANQDFQTKEAASTADFCFCVTESIKARLSPFNKRVYKINHGYNFVPGAKNGTCYDQPSRLTAVYAGNLSIPYIDWRLLCDLTEKNRHVDFLFIGPGENEFTGDPAMRSAKKQLMEGPNVKFPGRVEFQSLQQFYKNADILLLAYQEKYQADQVTNSHKIMEYLASGRIVVSTFTREYVFHQELLAMSETNGQFPALFHEVVNNLEFYNSQELAHKRVLFAKDNAYEKQIERIEGIVYGH